MAYVSELQDQVDETTELMKENVAHVLARGEKLDEMVIRAEELGTKAEVFQDQASKAKSKFQLDAHKWKIIVISTSVVLILIILVLALSF